jgi:hypothetical protein
MMGQVTIYIDKETEAKMILSAKAANVSKSKWISDVIREKVAAEWSSAVHQLAGAWDEFPSAEELRLSLGKDGLREDI